MLKKEELYLIVGSSLGGLVLVIVLIIIIACVCRNRGSANKRLPHNEDYELTGKCNHGQSTESTIMSSQYDYITDHNEIKPTIHLSSDSPNTNTHYDNVPTGEMIVNDSNISQLRHQSQTHKQTEDLNGSKQNDQEVGAHNLYHVSEPQQYSDDNNRDDKEDVMVLNDMYHSYGKREPNHGADEEKLDDKEDVMVLNNMYHSYGKQEPNHGADEEHLDDKEDVMEVNDMYHSYCQQNPKQRADEEQLDDKEDVMVVNDIYHRYVKQTPKQRADDDKLADQEAITVATDLYQSFGGHETAAAEIQEDEVVVDDSSGNEDVMVTNDLYHSYREPAALQSSESIDEEDDVMVDNALYSRASAAMKEGNH